MNIKKIKYAFTFVFVSLIVAIFNVLKASAKEDGTVNVELKSVDIISEINNWMKIVFPVGFLFGFVLIIKGITLHQRDNITPQFIEQTRTKKSSYRWIGAGFLLIIVLSILFYGVHDAIVNRICCGSFFEE